MKYEGYNRPWPMPLIPALERQRQVDLFEFKDSLVYRVRFGIGSKAREKPCLIEKSHCLDRHSKFFCSVRASSFSLQAHSIWLTIQ